MSPFRVAVALLTLALGACGLDHTTSPVSADLQFEARDLPDPCSLLPPSVAAQLLQAEAPRQEGLINEKGVARVCNYAVTVDEQQRHMFLSLTVFPAGLMSSAHDSRQQLVDRATALAGGLAPSVISDDPGIISFVFERDNATRLQVLTGMGGVDPDTGEPVSELQLGYAITMPGTDAKQRREWLLAQARSAMQQLQDAAIQ